jgi:hypothetical protein
VPIAAAPDTAGPVRPARDGGVQLADERRAAITDKGLTPEEVLAVQGRPAIVFCEGKHAAAKKPAWRKKRRGSCSWPGKMAVLLYGFKQKQIAWLGFSGHLERVWAHITSCIIERIDSSDSPPWNKQVAKVTVFECPSSPTRNEAK